MVFAKGCLQMQKGLKKLFYNLAIAAKKAEKRKQEREKLRGYLKKVRIISSRSPRQSAIHEELTKLEQHLSTMLDKKLHLKYSSAKQQELISKRLSEKEKELDAKIARLNKLLFKVGKKVNTEEFKKQLGKANPLIEQLEEKLYSLESKYYEIEGKYPPDALSNLKEKISILKEKIRELKG